MSESRTTADREIAARFADGPTVAPATLLRAALAGTSRTPQRPALVAALLGAPAAGRRADVVVRGVTRRELAILGLLAAALVGGILVAGAAQRFDQKVVVVSKASPQPSRTAPPTARPTPRATEVPAPTFDFAPPEPTTVGKLRLTMPAGWLLRPGTTTLNVEPAGGGIFSRDQQVIALEPGAKLFIQRPVMQGAQGYSESTGFSISGDTYEELVASVDGAMNDAARTQIRIDGVKAYRWSVPQTSYIHPLVAVAAVEWRGTFYVFVEHLGLDGDPGNAFQVLLDGVKLLTR
jgi:hypothetical protein